MKKIILYISLALLLSTHGYAACAEGTEITGKNGHVYCKSKVSMNWYTAFTWCDAQGRTLATMEQMCDVDETQKWDGDLGEGKCLNLEGVSSEKQYVWTAVPNGSMYAILVYLPTANVHPFYTFINRSVGYHVLCW